jgi:hypothetical protein
MISLWSFEVLAINISESLIFIRAEIVMKFLILYKHIHHTSTYAEFMNLDFAKLMSHQHYRRVHF